jgi:competence protein ComEC
VSPEIAVISLGAKNSYGHPHGETIEKLENAGVIIYRTDVNGTIVISSNGNSLTVR